MIIRIYPYMTLKESPLNNRSVRRACGRFEGMDCTLNDCPVIQAGRPFQGLYGK